MEVVDFSVKYVRVLVCTGGLYMCVYMACVCYMYTSHMAISNEGTLISRLSGIRGQRSYPLLHQPDLIL